MRILAGHPGVELVHATSRGCAGAKVHTVHPNLRGVVDLKFEDIKPETVAEESDLVFTCVPHGAAMDIVPSLLKKGVKVVDLSGDFRFKDIKTYERYYGVKHRQPDIHAVYGLPELNREDIKGADMVSNPGCYPTATIFGLLPLVKEEAIDPRLIVADAKSGVSGAGASSSPTTHFCSADEDVSAYNPVFHRHMPEIEQELSAFDKPVKVSFVPHLVPVIRGLSVTLHCFLRKTLDEARIREMYEKVYSGEPFIRVLETGGIPRLSAVRGSNYLDIGCFKVDAERNRVIVVAALDNLVKGASGQAVQNMNIMFGLAENTGLESVALHP